MQLHQPEYHIHVVPLIQLPFWIVLCCVILPQRLFDHLHWNINIQSTGWWIFIICLCNISRIKIQLYPYSLRIPTVLYTGSSQYSFITIFCFCWTLFPSFLITNSQSIVTQRNWRAFSILPFSIGHSRQHKEYRESGALIRMT